MNIPALYKMEIYQNKNMQAASNRHETPGAQIMRKVNNGE